MRSVAGDPAQCVVESFELERVQAFAQHGFEGVFPAAVDVERVPQALGVGQLMLRQPAVDILPATDLRLQRRERLRTRLQVGEQFAVALPRFACRALPILQRLHGRGKHVLGGLLARKVGAFLRQLFFDLGNRRRHRRRELGQLGVQLFAP